MITYVKARLKLSNDICANCCYQHVLPHSSTNTHHVQRLPSYVRVVLSLGKSLWWWSTLE